MNTDGKAVHQGKLVEEYRKNKKWSREKLAEALHVDISTVYRIEQRSLISDLERRRFLVGLLGIPAALMGLGENEQPVETHLPMNNDRMAFFEHQSAARWNIYHTGGTILANQGLDIWIKEMGHFAKDVSGSVWQSRALASLSMSFQLEGSILRDMVSYDLAHQAYQKAYKIAQEINNPELMASALARQGVTFVQQGKPLEAINYFNGSLNTINGHGFACLRGYTLQGLSEAFAMSQQPNDTWHSIDLAENSLEHQGDIIEHSNCTPNTSSISAQKGVDAVLLRNYGRAITLFDKSLKTYNPIYVRGRARLIAQKAEAFLGINDLLSCTDAAEEAILLANAVGSNKTLERIRNLYMALNTSRWKHEPSVARLGTLLEL